MAHTESQVNAEDDSRGEVTEQLLRLSQRIEAIRRQAWQAQQMAAASFDKSADSHDRTARSYETLAEHTKHTNDYLQHADRHHEYAQQDRGIAQRLRQMAESGLAANARRC